MKLKMKIFTILIILGIILSGCTAKEPNTGETTPPSAEQATGLVQPTITYTPSDTRHEPNSAHPFFYNYLTATDGILTLNIQEEIYDEESAVQLWDKLTSDLSTIYNAVPAERNAITVYIIQKLQPGNDPRIGNTAYFKAEELDSQSYREQLIRIALCSDGEMDLWKLHGAYALAYGELPDDTALRDYYATTEDIDILSLFPAYLIDDFASDEELKIAMATSVLLSDYIIKNHGAEAFLNDKGSYRQEWLASIGVDRQFDDQYAEVFAGYSYLTNDANYPLIVTTSRGDLFYLKPILDMGNPSEILRLFYEAKEGTEAFIAAIREYAPDYLDAIQNNFNSPIKYYCVEASRSTANWETGTVFLTKAGDLLHETAHIMIPNFNRSDIWKSEAIAMYMPLKFYLPSTWKKSMVDYEKWYHEIRQTDLDEDILREIEVINEYLHENTMSYDIYSKIIARTEMLYDADTTPWVRTIDKAYESPPTKGGELTYYQAYCLMDYLVTRYSFATVMDYCTRDVAFEEVFGISYEQAKVEWLESYF